MVSSCVVCLISPAKTVGAMIENIDTVNTLLLRNIMLTDFLVLDML